MAPTLGTPLYLRVAEQIRSCYLGQTPAGVCLPSDAELAKRWAVSTRTVREALLLLEAGGRVKRVNGKGTVVCSPDLPVALYCELNLLSPAVPRFYGLVLDLTRRLLEKEGYNIRLYTGRSEPGDVPGSYTCPDLMVDAQA